MEHNKAYFNQYVTQLTLEMQSRGIKYQEKYDIEINIFCNKKCVLESYPEHNNRYLKQCYYNLQEKYDRGIIGDAEWQKIKEVINYE